jgi:uncharacterized Zn-binding protein involved in type VI secretion
MGHIVTNGNPTSTRGVVIATDSTNMNMGKYIALHGDHATCGNCGPGSWPIIASANYMSFHGRAVVQHGDWVACPCRKNQVIAMSADMYYGDHSDGKSTQADAMASESIATSNANTAYDRVFVIKNNQTGQPLPSVKYRLTLLDGTTVEGVTDGQGMTQQIAAASQQNVKIEVYV